MKIVTLCGSMRFCEQMQQTAEELELERGWVVLGVTPHVMPRALTDAQKRLLGDLHRRKIVLADAIFVVNVGGYIGESVRAEIAYAERMGKQVMYLEQPDISGIGECV